MGIDDLSQELIDMIALHIEAYEDQSHLPLLERKRAPSKLPLYATISRKWQHAVERRTFQAVTLESKDLEYFAKILSASRVAFLSNLAYIVVLPSYSEEACGKIENWADRLANNEAFTQAIQDLFHILSSYQFSTARSIRLSLIEPYSKTDPHRRDPAKLDADQWKLAFGKREDIWEKRYEHSYLELIDPDPLPAVRCISALIVSSSYGRKIAPHTAVTILSQLYNVETITWSLNDNERRFPLLRRQIRNKFAKAISHLSLPSLEHLDLSLYTDAPSNQNFRPMVVSPSDREDPLSSALWKLSLAPNLTFLSLGGPVTISADLFGRLNLPSSSIWPNLKEMHVMFNTVTPNGNWYFIRDPEPHGEEDGSEEGGEGEQDDDDDDDESDNESDDESESKQEDTKVQNQDQTDGGPDYSAPAVLPKRVESRHIGDLPVHIFRTFPYSDTISPLLISAAEAASHMSKLKTFTLACELMQTGSEPLAEFEIQLTAPWQGNEPDMRTQTPSRSYEEGIWRSEWRVGRWRPNDEVLQAWQQCKPGVVIDFV